MVLFQASNAAIFGFWLFGGLKSDLQQVKRMFDWSQVIYMATHQQKCVQILMDCIVQGGQDMLVTDSWIHTLLEYLPYWIVFRVDFLGSVSL